MQPMIHVFIYQAFVYECTGIETVLALAFEKSGLCHIACHKMYPGNNKKQNERTQGFSLTAAVLSMSCSSSLPGFINPSSLTGDVISLRSPSAPFSTSSPSTSTLHPSPVVSTQSDYPMRHKHTQQSPPARSDLYMLDHVTN